MNSIELSLLLAAETFDEYEHLAKDSVSSDESAAISLSKEELLVSQLFAKIGSLAIRIDSVHKMERIIDYIFRKIYFSNER